MSQPAGPVELTFLVETEMAEPTPEIIEVEFIIDGTPQQVDYDDQLDELELDELFVQTDNNYDRLGLLEEDFREIQARREALQQQIDECNRRAVQNRLQYHQITEHIRLLEEQSAMVSDRMEARHAEGDGALDLLDEFNTPHQTPLTPGEELTPPPISWSSPEKPVGPMHHAPWGSTQDF